MLIFVTGSFLSFLITSDTFTLTIPNFKKKITSWFCVSAKPIILE